MDAGERKGGDYDCLLLYSGGKDSTYVVSKLLHMGLNVLAYFFDNGYTSEQAYKNIIHSFEQFQVDYVIDKQENMNDIFLSGIKKECSVCNGCFKVLSYRSLKLAFEKGIRGLAADRFLIFVWKVFIGRTVLIRKRLKRQ